jgi:hypothetical protein
MILNCNCSDCIFDNLCLYYEKMTRNFDGLCDDFTLIDNQEDDDGVCDNTDPKFPFGG